MSLNVSQLGEKVRDLGITDLVVWGLRNCKHTHRYIHRGVYRVFESIAQNAGLRAAWYDDAPDAFRTNPNLTERRTFLFFSSPHYDWDKHIPILDDAYYIAHADSDLCWATDLPIEKYSDHVRSGTAIYWAVFRGIPTGAHGYEVVDRSKLVFFHQGERRLLMPWATDLLPDEVRMNKEIVARKHTMGELFGGSKVLFAGTVWQVNENVIAKFSEICAKHKLQFSVERIVDAGELATATQASYMAPAIQGEAHITSETEFYVPCRIIKNISYGAIGVTNNPGVNKLFGNNLICNTNLEDLVLNYRTHTSDFTKSKLDLMLWLMDDVLNHHTYFNRIGQCLDALRKRG